MNWISILSSAGSFVVGLLLLAAIFYYLRTVVPTNQSHIVQRRKSTIPYGKDQEAGNVYYKWPTWVPFWGITRIILPVSNFDIDLEGYNGYDVGRVPFVVDVKAFFRIKEPSIAAQRAATFREVQEQLKGILQGAIRTILASAEIETILQARGEFGEAFTKEVDDQLVEWGVGTVKNIEFMDIRDTVDSHVIENIMKKKKSLIEKESRVEVAENMKVAEIAEIEATRQTQLADQEALEVVGKRTAEKDKAVGIANEKAQQDIKDEAKKTAEKDMAVLRVKDVKQAEIAKDVLIVDAQQQKQTTVIVAEGDLAEKLKEAEGIKAEGLAKAEAEKAMKMAPVMAQIELAKEIGSNEGYQKYLLGIEGLQVEQVVGVAKAEALKVSDLKVIANSGDVTTGVDKIMDIFSPKGGTAVGGMLEAFQNTEGGAALLKKFGIDPKGKTTKTILNELSKHPEAVQEFFGGADGVKDQEAS